MTVPPGWTHAQIGDLCDLINGKAFKPKDWSTSGLPIIRIQNLNNPGASFNYCDFDVEGRFLVDPGELLFAWSGTPGTSFGAHIWNGPKAVLNQHIFRVRFDEDQLDKSYFRRAINAKLDELIGKAHGGVGLAHVTKGKFEATEIALPPLAEQRRIVAKLDALTARLARARAELDRVPVLAARMKGAALTAMVGVDEHENVSELRNHLDSARTGPFGSSVHKSDYVEGGTPLINPMHIQAGQIVPSPNVTVAGSKAHELRDFAMRGGDVIIGRRGEMGRCAVVREDQEGYLIGTGSMSLRPAQTLSSEYLQLYLSSPAVIAALEQAAVGSTMVNLNQKILLGLPILVPDMDEQAKRVGKVQQAFARADRLEAEATRARSLLDRLEAALLAKAFRGELVPQDSSDEPAQTLLDRIRTGRAAAPKAKRGRKAKVAV